MKTLNFLVQHSISAIRSPFALFGLFALLLGAATAVHGQTLPSGWQEGLSLSAGGTASGYYLGYDHQKIVGPAMFVDADTKYRLGVEGEARFLRFPQNQSVRNNTWLVGARFSVLRFDRRIFPYAKTMIGFTQFNFPYSYAKGDYLVIAPGGGIDYGVTPRVRLRIIDAEYQIWPQFSYTSIPSWGISTGVRVRVF
jgi:hypothetical protein